MNNINVEQNKEENLLLLFSQKILYEKTKKTKYFIVFLGLVNFLLGIASKTILGHTEYFLIATFIIMLFSQHLKKDSCKFNNLAAATQELVDRKLYGFEIESRDLGGHSKSYIISTAKNLSDKKSRKYSININNSGTDTPNGVKNWYTDIAPNLPLDEAIMKCQGQNIYWDKYLIKYYKNLLKISCVIILIIFLFLYWNNELKDFVLGLISSYSILEIITKELSKANESTTYHIEIDSILSTSNNLGTINLNLLKDLQSKIYLRRDSCFNVPSFLHKLNSGKLHRTYSRDN